MKKEGLVTSSRVESLDSFRGIASVLIMLTHFILFVPEVFQVENLSLIYDWLSWKLPYFFVLSGFVLTLSYMRSRGKTNHIYSKFIINRIFRIYPLFMLTTIMVFTLKVVFDAGADIEGASRFLNISWRIAPDFVNLIHALTLVSFANTWVIIAISVAVTLVVARLSFLHIETPCISLGHHITRK